MPVVILQAPVDFRRLEVTCALDCNVGEAGEIRAPRNGADLHGFYFNLEDVRRRDLEISSDDDVRTAYKLKSGSRVWGGAGSRFQFRVNLGSGAGRKGNGVLQMASFTIDSETGDLFLSDLLPMSSTSRGLEANFAAHVQGTITGGGSETVGALVPGTVALLAAGLLSIAVRRRAPLR